MCCNSISITLMHMSVHVSHTVLEHPFIILYMPWYYAKAMHSKIITSDAVLFLSHILTCLPALIANADLALGLEYWSHSVLCAHVAEELACVLHLPQPNKAQDSE